MKPRRIANCSCPSAVVMLVSVGVARADFIGSTALLEAYYPDLETLVGSWGPEIVVDPGVEFPSEEGFPWDTDVSMAAIRLDHLVDGNFLGEAEFNGFVLTFSDLATPIADVELDPSSTLVPTEYWATADQVFIDYAGPRVIDISFTLLNVTFAPASPGDVDGNGVVDFADLLAVLAGWGPCQGECPADLDGDGFVDFADLSIVLANWS